MPQYTSSDRRMIQAEQAVWMAREAIVPFEDDCGAWTQRIKAIVESLEDISHQLHLHNDQFEEDE